MQALLGHRTEEQPGEPAPPSGADDQQVGTGGGVDEDRRRASLDDPPVKLVPGVGSGDLVDHMVQQLAGGPLKIPSQGVHGCAGHVTDHREQPGVYDLEGGLPQPSLVHGPAQRGGPLR